MKRAISDHTGDGRRPSTKLRFSLLLCLCVFAVILSCISCSTKPTDVRTVIPADSLVYLETNDLGKAIQAVVETDAFRGAAKTQPDLSALNGIRMAIAVTGFETKEIPTGDGPTELNLQPHFVAVAETNAWNYQAIGFTENKLGEFINEIYGGGVELERFPRHEGDYFVWTAQDGRKAYGLVIGSVIFFGNDESAIEKCVAVRKGEAESIAKNEKLPSGDLLASGYVSPEGAGQIANLAAVQVAIGAGEEEEVRGFIARVLPEILRNTIKEATWTSRKTEQGIEDEYLITTEPETAKVLSETIVSTAGSPDAELMKFIPTDAVAVTRYDLKDPQIAWRSVLLTAQKKTDAISGNLIAGFSSSLFEPYGIEQPEEFLSAVDGRILTIRFDPEGEEVVGVATVKDLEKAKRSMMKEFSFSKPSENVNGADLWKSGDSELAFASLNGRIVFGNAEGVARCLAAFGSGQANDLQTRIAAAGNAPSVTVAVDADPAAELVSVLAERKDDKQQLVQQFQITTEFTPSGIRRREVSSFGLIGSVIEQFAKE